MNWLIPSLTATLINAIILSYIYFILVKKVKHNQQKEIAENANKVKDNFLANISHELKTPLNGAMGMLELLKDMEQSKENRYYLDLAAQSVDRLYSVIKDLLDFVQIDAGKLGLIIESFDFDRMINYSKGLFTDQLKRKNLSVIINNLGSDNIFTGDKARIAQIINSLLSNAVKFSRDGSITISYSINPNLEISISDEGIGIQKDKIDDIFKTLEQLEDPYTKQYDGLGLGLAIVKNLVNLMKGELSVKSELGKGTIFTIAIPASSSILPPKTAEEKEKKESLSSPEDFTILIAEDESINRIFIKEILKNHNFTVTEAENGKEVLELVNTQKTDLILMDIGMPVLNGLDTIKELQKMKNIKTIPILALTAYTEKDDISQFLAAGFTEILAKPITEKGLIKTIKAYLP